MSDGGSSGCDDLALVGGVDYVGGLDPRASFDFEGKNLIKAVYTAEVTSFQTMVVSFR